MFLKILGIKKVVLLSKFFFRFERLYSQGLLCQLGFEFYHLEIFEGLLTMKGKQLLHVRNAYCKFKEAQETCVEAQKYISILKASDHPVNLAGIYAEFSDLFFCRSDYSEAYKWSLQAIEELHSGLSPKIIVDIFRQAAKVVVRK
ncbi:amyloid protein-binding protein 2-like isoform X2 [Tachypleus tridentatus]|uniref:amyloid protein-binding protein 2-like isoform X2 n=1 Tax=Tachypleus tridentatus TaxID=6853 RepID=UPI003FD380E9